jgi:arginyl-tRNA synthetase
MSILHDFREFFEPVLLALGTDAAKVPDYLGMIKPAADAKHGDYQANFCMALAKAMGKKPQDLAREVVEMLPTDDLVESASVAGPGFINLKLKDAWLADRVAATRSGAIPNTKPKTFVIDYSGPNVAKPLHVGHLRSTIIGDSLVRILRFLGHTVIGDNHLGDWGTQFGILIYGYKHHLNAEAFAADPVRELARLYVHVRQLAAVTGDDDDAKGDVMDECRKETAKLHAGDPENVELWNRFMPACLEMLRPIYERLDVKIDHALGESFYNPMLPSVVESLLAKGIAVESNGALVIPNAKGIVPEAGDSKEEPPALIRKRDGAFTYTTTDMATIQYRAETWSPDALLYVVDARQALHFKTVFANARRWGYDGIEYQHVAFGSILGKDKRPFKTRDGGTIELSQLLDEAEAEALRKYEQSHAERKSHGHDIPELTAERKKEIAEVVGIGAVKYADLSGNRTSDYVFDYDKMLATDGNTATYMQYAYARSKAIFRKGQVDFDSFQTDAISLAEPAERALAVQLLKFRDAVEEAAAKYEPHHVAAYLWDLAKAFNGFFETCPVLTAPTPELKASRLMLVKSTGQTIRTALGLLGIGTVEQM